MTQCRTDNGLCFHKIEQPYGASYAYFHFCDGTIYSMQPLKTIELYNIAAGTLEAGCWFNRTLARRRGFIYAKLAMLIDVSSARWLTLTYEGKHIWKLTLTPP